MPCTTFPIDAIGPVLEIGISAPLSLNLAGSPAHIIHWIKAIVDTGCSNTSIFTGTAKQIGLKPIGKTQVNSTTATSVAADIYLADMAFRYYVAGAGPFEFILRDRPLIELMQKSANHDALLGMETIGIGVLVSNGATKSATFCW